MNTTTTTTTNKRLPPYVVLSRLVCAQCGDFLSCDPVHVLPNNDVHCGRCARTPSAPSAQAVRSIAFEDVAGYFVFPCRYDMCRRLLERADVLLHEQKCEFARCGCYSCWRRCLMEDIPAPKPAGIYHVVANERTHELITCTHCFGYLSSAPIFLRPNSTYICYRCGPDLQAPPVLRDTALENLLDCFVLKCSYRMNGCTDYYKFGVEMVEHEMVCSYNPQKQFHPTAFRGGDNNAKIRGVIATIASGHIYATITPNHFNHYHKQMEETKKRAPQIPRASIQSPEGHHQPDKPDISGHSSITFENHRWDLYSGGDDEGVKRAEIDEEDHLQKQSLKSKFAGIGVVRNESILYNNVVTEIKFKQHVKKTPAFQE